MRFDVSSVGEPSRGPAANVFELLRQAGCPLDDPPSLRLGLMGYNAAVLLRLDVDRVAEARAKTASGTARNAPCPCGSRRKYKRCCFARDKEAQRIARLSTRRSLDPALIPKLWDMKAMMRDTVTLSGLFQDDPSLRRVRFTPPKAAEYLSLAVRSAGARSERAADDTFVDEVAARFVRDVEGKQIMEALPDKLVEAAQRITGPDELRSLSLGFMYAMSWKNRQDEPNPIVAAIFRLSANEHVKLVNSLRPVFDQLGSEKLASLAMPGDTSDVAEDLKRVIGALGPEVHASLREVFQLELDHLTEMIRGGRFPVPLPLASLLPLFSRLQTSSRKLSRDELSTLLGESADQLQPEDLRLYRHLLDEWLQSHQGRKGDRASEADLLSAVAVVRSMADGGVLYPLDFPLLVTSLQHSRWTPLPGEVALDEPFDLPLRPEFLQRYAKLLEDLGYPALAQRTRSLGA